MKHTLSFSIFPIKFAIPALVAIFTLLVIGSSFLYSLDQMARNNIKNMERTTELTDIIVNHDFRITLQLREITGRLRSLNGDFYQFLFLQHNSKTNKITLNNLQNQAQEIFRQVDLLLNEENLYIIQKQDLESIKAKLRRHLDPTSTENIFDLARSITQQKNNFSISYQIQQRLEKYHDDYLETLNLCHKTAETAFKNSTHHNQEVIAHKKQMLEFVEAARLKSRLHFLTSLIILTLVAGGVSYYVSQQTTASINQIVKATEKLASGDVSIPVASLERGDELNTIVNALNVFRHNLIELKRIRKEQDSFIQELTYTREEALAASRAKSDFLANMSHELRTPLNSLMGLVALVLQRTPTDSEHYSLLTNAHQAGEILLQLLHDTLDLTAIETGRLSLETISFDLHTTITKILDVYAFTAQKKGIDYSYQISNHDPITVIGDPVRFGQILTNLTGNAIKFTDHGHVKIRIFWSQTAPTSVNLNIVVEDTGIGIAIEQQNQIFQKFFQADGSIRRRFGGSGLGLAITRQLITAMNGEIHLQSTPGLGSTFTINLPMTLASTTTITPEKNLNRSQFSTTTPKTKTQKAQARLLIGEDHMMNRLFITHFLKQTGFNNYTLCENGEEVVHHFMQGGYHLILMDCHMPVLDGYEATHTIRAYEERTGQSPIPIIALTADAMNGTRERCLAAGMDNYISKPVNITELEKIIGEWIELT